MDTMTALFSLNETGEVLSKSLRFLNNLLINGNFEKDTNFIPLNEIVLVFFQSLINCSEPEQIYLSLDNIFLLISLFPRSISLSFNYFLNQINTLNISSKEISLKIIQLIELYDIKKFDKKTIILFCKNSLNFLVSFSETQIEKFLDFLFDSIEEINNIPIDILFSILLPFLRSNSSEIQIRTFRILLFIYTNIDPPKVFLFELIEYLNRLTNTFLIENILKVILNWLKKSYIFELIISIEIQFDIFLKNELFITNPQIISYLFLIIIHLLPKGKIGQLLFPIEISFLNSNLTNIPNLFLNVGNYCINNLNNPLSIKCFCLISEFLKNHDHPQMIPILKSLSINSEIAPFILLLLINYSNKKSLIELNIINILQRTKIEKNLQSYYNKNLSIFLDLLPKPPSVSNLYQSKNFLEFLNLFQLIPIKTNFLSDRDLTSKIIKLLQENKSIINDNQIELFIDLFNNFLNEIKTHHQKNLIKIPFNIPINIFDMNKNQFNITLNLHSLFYELEFFYNFSINPNLYKILLNKLKSNIYINKIGDFSNNYRYLSVLCRSSNIPNYILCKFEFQGNFYSVNDNISNLLLFKGPYNIKIINNNKNLNKYNLNFKIKENIPYYRLKFINDFLYYFPNINLEENSNLKIKKKFIINNFVNSSLLLNFDSQFIYNFPFLFSFDTRFLLFHINSFSLIHCYQFLQQYPDILENENNLKIIFEVNKETLFDDGINIIHDYFSGINTFNVSFKNDIGTGLGPTKEFFTLMSKIFQLNSLKIWRNNNLNDEYVSNKQGLFPRPSCNYNLFYYLGIFIAKALQYQYILDLPINPSFFKLCFGYNILLEDIDNLLFNSLQEEEGLIDLQFVYPVYEFELKPKGREIYVDLNNVKEYIKLIKEKSIDKTIYDAIESFKNGFSTISNFESLNLFRPFEIINLICGDNSTINLNDLYNYTKPQHGYDFNSKEIKWLFEILISFNKKELSLFWKFLTGVINLPFGGLSKLNPIFSIAKKIDNEFQNNALPSASTCFHYLKLPPYQNKKIMKEKLLIAILHGNESFDFN